MFNKELWEPNTIRKNLSILTFLISITACSSSNELGKKDNDSTTTNMIKPANQILCTPVLIDNINVRIFYGHCPPGWYPYTNPL